MGGGWVNEADKLNDTEPQQASGVSGINPALAADRRQD